MPSLFRVPSLMLLLALIAGCRATKYESPSFAAKTQTHKTIAVLPPQMIMSGKRPAKLTQAQVAQIEEAESRAFQLSLQNGILRQAGSGKKDIRIEVQDIQRTNRLLEQNGYSIRQSWDQDADKLARLLGVDAVVRTKIAKTRYMSSLASYGIDLGTTIIDILTDWNISLKGLPLPTPDAQELAKTHDIDYDAALINAQDGSLLWKFGIKEEADWQYTPEEIIDGLSRRVGRNFPYRGPRG